MKILKQKQRYGGDDRPFHLIQKTEWINGNDKTLLVLQVKTWCDKRINTEAGDSHMTYKKTSHRKFLCIECVRMIKRAHTLSLYRAPDPR